MVNRMALQYMVDNEGKYDEVLLKHLRAHNVSQVGERYVEKRVFYVYQNDELVASAKTNLFWDWVSPYEFFYKDQDSLFALMNEIVRYFKGLAVGINTSSFVAFVIKDLLAYGFVDTGRMNRFYQGNDKVSLELRSWETKEINSDYLIVHAKEEVDEVKDLWQSQFDAFIKRCDFSLDYVTHQIVCVDGEEFVGGVLGYKQFECLYVSLLVVKEDYRKQGIAKKLMTLLEEHANSEGIDMFHLGTGSFQAKGFYEKLGYKVACEQIEKPKGHTIYTMVKE